jgi:tRNA 2-selenouridine synthase
MKNLCSPLADLEIREFSSYALIIDARSPREFAVDHLPHAVNLPVVDDEQYADVGRLHRTDTHAAYVLGVTESLRNMANSIGYVAQRCNRSDPILVYCFRGGKRSKLWSDTLRTIGYKVDVLRGGWKAYRRWVLSALEVMPRALEFKVVAGPTGSGKTRLLQALQRQGAQVLDLEAMACHRGSLLGALPGKSQPTQKSFDSELMGRLREMDPQFPVYVESESKKIGNLTLPGSLMDAMARADMIRITAPLGERVKVWEEDFRHFVEDPSLLLARVAFLEPLLGKELLARWAEQARSGRVSVVFEELMTRHYDPAYVKSNARLFSGRAALPVIELESVSDAYMDGVARHIRQSFDGVGQV